MEWVHLYMFKVSYQNPLLFSASANLGNALIYLHNIHQFIRGYSLEFKIQRSSFKAFIFICLLDIDLAI